MENNSQREKSGEANKKNGGRNKYVDTAAMFIAGTLTTYLAFKSEEYSFLNYVVVFACIYLPIVGLHRLFERLAARKSGEK